MSETLQGVLMGGIITSIIPLFGLFFENKKWKREKKLDYLKAKREKMEQQFKEAMEELYEIMRQDDKQYPFTLISDFEHIFPKPLNELFIKMVTEKDKTEQKTKECLMEINSEMKKHLTELDLRVEKLFE